MKNCAEKISELLQKSNERDLNSDSGNCGAKIKKYSRKCHTGQQTSTVQKLYSSINTEKGDMVCREIGICRADV